MKKCHLLKLLAAIVIFIAALPPGSDGQTPFTPADALEVVSLGNLALSPDGKFIAGIRAKRSKTRLNANHFRFGDATYVRPFDGDLMLYSVDDGQGTVIASGHVLSPVWSPDGEKLAFIRMEEDDEFRLYVYDRSQQESRHVEVDTEKPIASNASLAWLDDNRVFLGFRSPGWTDQVKKMFAEATRGPVVVYDSDEPFLKWDAIRNFGQLRSIGQVNVNSGKFEELLPEGSYANLQAGEDGQFIAFVKNHPVKTTYNRRDGTQYELRRFDLGGAVDSAVVLLKKTFERKSLRWSENKNWFAWSEKGDIYVQSVFSDSATNITAGKTPLSQDDTTEVKFTVLGWDPAERTILARSEQGFWLADRDCSERRMFYTFEGEEDDRPEITPIDWDPNGRYVYF